MSELLLVLDPGHGGKDPGAIGPTGLREKDVALEVALEVRDRLHAFVPVRMTREADTFVDLSERARLANSWAVGKIALFLSVHFNAANGRAHGFEAFTSPGNTSADPIAAGMLWRYAQTFPEERGRFDFTDGADDPDKEASFTVLEETRMPAVLFECGFIDNAEYEERLRDGAYLSRIASGLTEGVLEWAEKVRPTPPAPVVDAPELDLLRGALEDLNSAKAQVERFLAG